MPGQPYTNQELELLFSGFDREDQAALKPVMPLLYGFYQDKAGQIARLRYHYVRRHMVDHLLTTAGYTNVDVVEGDEQAKLGQKFQNLDKIRSEAQGEIERLERQARANRAPQVGAMTTTEVEGPVYPLAPDPGDSAYRGSPQKRTYWPR